MFIRMNTVPAGCCITPLAHPRTSLGLVPKRQLAPVPRDYLASGAWPEGQLKRGAPAEARLLAGIAQRLAEAMEGTTLRTVSKNADVSLGAISNLLNGKTWCDVVTVARLERALEVSLWGTEHR